MKKAHRAVLAVAIVVFAGTAWTLWFISATPADEREAGILSTFESERDLKEFLREAYEDFDSEYPFKTIGAPEASPILYDESESGALPYSSTNVQVAGIDEQDIVKTDGEFIFVSNRDKVSVIKAYPPADMEVVAEMTAEDILSGEDNASVSITGLYLADDRLAIISDVNERYFFYYEASLGEIVITDDQLGGPRTMVTIVDVSDESAPEIMYSCGISGTSLTSRYADNVVYLVSQSYIYGQDDVYLPCVWMDESSEEVSLGSIYYDPETAAPDSLINVMAIDLVSSKTNHISIMAGYASTVYMSHGCMFLTIQKWSQLPFIDAMTEQDVRVTTSIYKVAVDGLDMEAVARGDVKGMLLNQFSLDERGGYLRLATCTDWTNRMSNVYVLDEHLDLVGSLEGIAPDEWIYSTRFVGDTLYMVTYRIVDPLFVIDLSNPAHPTILGELTMPGFSTYLHPVDEGHLLGIGYEDWGSLKLSLYDVSDPAAPSEIDSVIIEGYSDSQFDHKAVLFDAELGILAIPVTTWILNTTSDSTYTYSYQSGLYVFDVSTSEGISLRGIVDVCETSLSYDSVHRSLYIADHIYAVSNYVVVASYLADLEFVSSVEYAQAPSYTDYVRSIEVEPEGT